MASVKIRCTDCGARFTLKTDSMQNLVGKAFQCPKCGTSVPFTQVIEGAQKPAALHTHIGGARGGFPRGNAPTRMSAAADKKVILEVEQLHKRFRLGVGSYTLGRDSADSKATVKIAPDRYMSRIQAAIEVRPGMSPSMPPVVTINPLGPTNPIFVNGQRLEMGTRRMLNNGDKLMLGMTGVTIKI